MVKPGPAFHAAYELRAHGDCDHSNRHTRSHHSEPETVHVHAGNPGSIRNWPRHSPAANSRTRVEDMLLGPVSFATPGLAERPGQSRGPDTLPNRPESTQLILSGVSESAAWPPELLRRRVPASPLL